MPTFDDHAKFAFGRIDNAQSEQLVKELQPAVDGYWLRMGTQMTEALRDVLNPDVTERRRQLVAEYLASMLDAAYKMGIRLGEMQAATVKE